MSVVRAPEAVPGTPIRLEGVCPVEDAETLTALLLNDPSAAVDWSACTHMHTAVFQALLALRPVTRGTCGDPLVARWLAPGADAAPEPDSATPPYAPTRS